MPNPSSVPAVTEEPKPGTAYLRRSPATGAEQERRIQWGKDSGAKVAAAYQQMQEGR
jgi:hypothetical protein